MRLPRAWAGLTAIAVLTVLTLLTQHCPRAERHRFSSVEWKRDDDGTRGMRRRMVTDLMRDGGLIGSAKADVEALLGKGIPAQHVAVDYEGDAFDRWDVCYRVSGSRSGGGWLDPFVVDISYLAAQYDAEGVLRDLRIMDTQHMRQRAYEK